MVEKVEAVPAVFWKVDHPGIGQKSNEHCDGTLDQKHPPPPSIPGMAVKLIKTKIHDRTRGKDDDLAALEECKAQLLLTTGIPG